MRILQIIDSLDAGGAERMAVNYANALAGKLSFSALAVTRKEGVLKEKMHPDAGYFFMAKKKTLDLDTIFRLKAYVKLNKIEIIHCHGSSFFTAVLLKIIYPRIRLIWHDHYGNSMFLYKRNAMPLKAASLFFDGIIAVNRQLLAWSKENLFCKEVTYLPNFAATENLQDSKTILFGEAGKRIVCLANLRVQKNHFLLIEVAVKLKETHPDWTFHLIGQDFRDVYSKKIKEQIANRGLDQHIFIYGTRPDIPNILGQSDIGILTSQSEGLPLALLEYGFCSKPVVTTAVGEIPNIIRHRENGMMVPSGGISLFYKAITEIIDDGYLGQGLGQALAETISNDFSEEVILNHYTNWLKKIL